MYVYTYMYVIHVNVVVILSHVHALRTVRFFHDVALIWIGFCVKDRIITHTVN